MPQSCAPSQHLFIAASADFAQEDPSIDFITAVKALARCSKPPETEAISYDQDVEMTDWNEDMNEGTQDNGKIGETVQVTRPHVKAFVARGGKQMQYARAKSGNHESTLEDGDDLSWQRRERMALKRAYAQAFTWWPHEKASKQQCESFLQKHSV